MNAENVDHRIREVVSRIVAEFSRFKEWRGHVFHSAAREGVVLHAA